MKRFIDFNCMVKGATFYVDPDSYIDIKFKVGNKWYKGYYEHLYGGCYMAYAWWTKKCKYQTQFEKELILEWQYL